MVKLDKIPSKPSNAPSPYPSPARGEGRMREKDSKTKNERRAQMKTIKLLTILSCICLALIWTLPLGALAQQKPIKIGGSLAITGPLADNASWIRRGYEYWAEKINKSGGLAGQACRARHL